MKILIIGGNGTIGKKVSDHFSKKHKVIIGGRNSGDVMVDVADSKSIEKMLIYCSIRCESVPRSSKQNGRPLIR